MAKSHERLANDIKTTVMLDAGTTAKHTGAKLVYNLKGQKENHMSTTLISLFA